MAAPALIKYLRNKDVTPEEANSIWFKEFTSESSEYYLLADIVGSALQYCRCSNIKMDSIELLSLITMFDVVDLQKCVACNCTKFLTVALRRKELSKSDLLAMANDLNALQQKYGGCCCCSVNNNRGSTIPEKLCKRCWLSHHVSQVEGADVDKDDK